MNFVEHAVPGRIPLRPRTALCVRTAAGAVTRFLAAGGRPRPPVPIQEMVAAEGFRIVLLWGAGDGVAGLLNVHARLIAVNARHPEHRRRFSLAHELGHVLMAHPPESRCSAEACRVFNREADLCASLLLMPPVLLEPLRDLHPGVGALARIFNVSREVAVRRIAEPPAALCCVRDRQLV